MQTALDKAKATTIDSESAPWTPWEREGVVAAVGAGRRCCCRGSGKALLLPWEREGVAIVTALVAVVAAVALHTAAVRAAVVTLTVEFASSRARNRRGHSARLDHQLRRERSAGRRARRPRPRG